MSRGYKYIGLKMNAIRRLKWMLFLFLLGWANIADAGVYWYPNSGNDTGDGTSAHPVKTWERAYQLLSTQGNDEWIYQYERLTISSTTTINGAISGKANARVKRCFIDFMFVVNSGVTLTLKNITISGEFASSNLHWDGTKSIIATSGVVVLDNDTVLKDNYVKSTDEPLGGAVRIWNAGTLTMNEGCLIENCRAEVTDGEGGAIMSGGNCTLNIYGGTIRNCHASRIGGAISLRSGSYTFNMTGGTIENCYSRKGGAAFIYPLTATANLNATINFSGGTIKDCNNAAILSGAAFYVGSY